MYVMIGASELPEQVRCSKGARDQVHPCRRYLERCKGKLLVARCAAVSRIRALAPRACSVLGRQDQYSMSRIVGFASLPFFFGHCKIRGRDFPDPLHASLEGFRLPCLGSEYQNWP